MKSQVFDIWEVAAALLLLEKFGSQPYGVDYKEITRKVTQTGLTKLGVNGKTPSQTMGYLLRTASYGGLKVFERTYVFRGNYKLRDKQWTGTIPQVRDVVEYITQREAHDAELARKDSEISRLRAKLKQIGSMCRVP